jgi:hypothetical protein
VTLIFLPLNLFSCEELLITIPPTPGSDCDFLAISLPKDSSRVRKSDLQMVFTPDEMMFTNSRSNKKWS